MSNLDATVPDNIKMFFSQYPTKHYKKGQILIYANENPPGIIHLLSGSVRQYDINGRGDEVVVNVFKPPAFFPMSWAINQTPNNYFFDTVTAVEVQQAPADEVIAYLKSQPAVTYDLLSRVYSGVDGLQRRMAHLMGGNAHNRLLFELVVECTRFGELQPDGTHLITISESEVAQRAGLSRETVNREFGKLKTQGSLTYKSGVVAVNLQSLKDELGNEL